MMIRTAGLADLDGILSLYREQFHVMAGLQPDYWKDGEQSAEFVRDMIMGDWSDVLMSETEDGIMGFALVQERKTSDFSFFVPHRFVYVMDIVVAVGSRGEGYGSALMDAVKSWGRERELEYIDLDVLANNESAIAFYQKHGFKPRRVNMICPLEE